METSYLLLVQKIRSQPQSAALASAEIFSVVIYHIILIYPIFFYINGICPFENNIDITQPCGCNNCHLNGLI